MPRHPLFYFIAIVAGAVCLLVAWVGLRDTLEGRMAAAAQRGLETIVELVAVELTHQANRPDRMQGEALLRSLAAQRPDFIKAVRNAEDSHFRHIYFFDAQGRALRAEATVQAIPATEIVRQALALSHAGARDWRGVRLDPYPDGARQEVIGVWLWHADARLGIVAERPYARFAQPLQWFDAAYTGFAALLTVGLVALARRHGSTPGGRDAARRCGPYDLIRPLGDGSMGHVYLARHRRLRRIVALKRLKPHAQSDELAARFEREARLASQLAHPNIVTVLDHGHVAGGGYYYTMEYIPGLTLSQWVERFGALPLDRALHVLLQICAAVSAMHRRQLLHRDIKPDNVMAYAMHDDYDRVKLLDFGLIKDCDQQASRDLTRDVRVLGTPAFMAPERLVDPGRVDRRSDLYGIACVGFYLLTGRKPFEASQGADLTQQVLHIEAPRVSGFVASLPAALDALIAEALAKDPERRPASVDLFRQRLEAIAAMYPWDRATAQAWWQAFDAADMAESKGRERTSSRLDVSLTSS